MGQIIVRDLKKIYAKAMALRGINFSLELGQSYAIVGASGSGKSTLLYLLAGLENPTSGEVIIDGKNIARMNDEELANYRNSYVGLVFQFHFLLPSMNCWNNVLLPAQIGGADLKEVKLRVQQLATELGIEKLLEKFPYELSGGEQQRVNLVRALSLRPKLLLCDEPTGSLDSVNSQKVVALLKEQARVQGATLIVVTHDHNVASQFSHRLVLQDGLLH